MIHCCLGRDSWQLGEAPQLGEEASALGRGAPELGKGESTGDLKYETIKLLSYSYNCKQSKAAKRLSLFC